MEFGSVQSHLDGTVQSVWSGVISTTNSTRLIGKDRVEEARDVIANLHADGDINHPLVNLQVEEMSASLREEGIMTWRKFFDLRVLFSTRARRYRLMLSKSRWQLLMVLLEVDKPCWAVLPIATRL